jgi:hypothetical protein
VPLACRRLDNDNVTKNGRLQVFVNDRRYAVRVKSRINVARYNNRLSVVVESDDYKTPTVIRERSDMTG